MSAALSEDACLHDDERDDGAEPRPAPWWLAWLEVAVLAALAIAARAVAGVALPWLALAPALAGLRYGASPGVACAAAEVAALIVAARHGVPLEPPGGQAILGWLIAGLVPGQFRDAWRRRLRGLELRSRGANRRLDGLARAYHLAVASHDQLQRELPGSPSSLRDAMEALAREAVESPEARPIDALGSRILNLFRAHGGVRAASLHAVDARGRAAPASAVLGTGAAREDDPLIREAARRSEVVSVRNLPASATLVAVPLADVNGRVHAVVAIRELPFLFLHDETLTLFAVLGGQLGDIVARALDPGRAIDAPAARAFCASVRRALVDARRHAIPAALAIVALEAPAGGHVPRALARCLAAHRRATDDAAILVARDGTLRVVILLRLTGAAGLDSYLARLDGVARARARELDARCEIRLRGWSLDDARLPRRLGVLEVRLAALMNDIDPAAETPLLRRAS